MKRIVIDMLLMILFLGVLILPISSLGWTKISNTNTNDVLSTSDERPPTNQPGEEDILESSQSFPTIKP